ncbi:MAG: hypothetical protein ACE5PT_14010, partial [Gemmatimonadales bacterium]
VTSENAPKLLRVCKGCECRTSILEIRLKQSAIIPVYVPDSDQCLLMLLELGRTMNIKRNPRHQIEPPAESLAVRSKHFLLREIRGVL